MGDSTKRIEDTEIRCCTACGISSCYPDITFDDHGVCSICQMYGRNKEKIALYFKEIDDLENLFDRARSASKSEFDCLLLFSGGKDSTYVLYRLVDLGLVVMTFTFDNGFISSTALDNIHSITAELNVDHVTATTENMNQLFVESLKRHSSVCNGCFKALLELGTRLAYEKGIRYIVTGLSRGQIVDERLSWFYKQNIFDPEEIEKQLSMGRKVYHSIEEYSAKLLDVNLPQAVFDTVEVIDFYRYVDVSEEQVLEYLKNRSPLWSRPGDTGLCSSNCKINDVGIYVHRRKKGFHNYESPTCWEVRFGHLSPAAARETLEAGIDVAWVKKTLDHIGYQDDGQQFHSPDRLAAAAGEGRVPAMQAGQGLVTGVVPLTPTQHRFFQRGLSDPHCCSQTILLKARRPLDPTLLKKAVLQLLVHHDALRLRFVQGGTGWQQSNADLGDVVPFAHLDLSRFSEAKQRAIVEAATARLQESLNLSQGPLLQVSLFDLGDHKSSLLLMVAHHLVMDDVSWRILLEDLQTAYEQLGRGEAIHLPPKTVSFKHWAERLKEYARSESLQREMAYWTAEPRTRILPLPVDYPKGERDNAATQFDTLSVSLSAQEIQPLLQETPEACHARLNEALLTALAQALAQWTGSRSSLVDLTSSGRVEITPGMDLSRTVGRFTAVFPALFDLEEASNPGDTFRLVQEQFGRIPNQGIGYGLLRYLDHNTDIAQKLQALPQAEVRFKYLGQLEHILPRSSWFELIERTSRPPHSLGGIQSYLLEINAYVVAGRLQVDWTYNENVHRQSTIECLARNCLGSLQSLIVHW